MKCTSWLGLHRPSPKGKLSSGLCPVLGSVPQLHAAVLRSKAPGCACADTELVAAWGALCARSEARLQRRFGKPLPPTELQTFPVSNTVCARLQQPHQWQRRFQCGGTEHDTCVFILLETAMTPECMIFNAILSLALSQFASIRWQILIFIPE